MNMLIRLAAQYLYLICTALAVVFWVRLDRPQMKQFAIWGILSGIIAIGITKISGSLISDPRPFVIGHYAPLLKHAADNGFPSDHTVLTSLLAFLILPYSWRFGIFMLVLAVLVGASRVAAGIHHTEDVIGGFVIACASMTVSYILVRSFYKKLGLPSYRDFFAHK